ncbi:MAG: glycosyl hydrolase [Algibacter sp.]|uniref:glycosyl hydrolase n=1 Tax=Algibacter sp. TaxID=1872428 RepID=UPI00260726B3|nr:glycosyl hydrolase [Algibacter sp.]MDG1729156.1 glycosyl hydrolase [Algibacter sp.]MDG2178413.1 glycosyl hydrolase [Algibacter sp.]
MEKNLLLFSILITSIWSYSQQIIWTGNGDNNDFFDETNWEDSNTNLAPASGTIDGGQPINLNLQLQNASSKVIANGVIDLGTGSLYVMNSSLQAIAFSSGSITIDNDGYVDLISANPFQNSVSINFTSGIGWIKTLSKKGVAINADNLGQIAVNNAAAVYPTNLRLDNYYLEGTVIRSNNLLETPLTLYDNTNLQGASANLSLDIIHSGSEIPNTLDNKAESFILKRGYMATFATTEDGTGKSKNYIASEGDLIVSELPSYLLNDISFIRIIPWNWVNKKGRTGPDTELNNTWNYQWNNTGTSVIEREYAPMAWGYGGANDDGDITLYKSKYKATHIMAFNEADNCNDQSGQYNNLCDTDVALSTYKNLMKTGLRLVSPSCRENAPFGWLKEFHDKANTQDIRIDVIAVHWYDWGSNPTNSPNATPQSVFNRFKTYLQNVHDLYGLPIWITEFNANPNRTNATNYGFMQLALPYLETLDYVERYVWYQPNSDVADYYDPSGTTLTNVGTFYRDQISNASIPQDILLVDSNLDIYYELQEPAMNNLFNNGDFELGDLTSWNGSNIGTLSNSNVYQGTTSGRILANAGNISQTLMVEPQVEYGLSFYTKWFVSPTSAIEVKILDANDDTVIANKLMTTSTGWNLVELLFTVLSGVNSIKFQVEKGTEPAWFIDNAVLTKTESLSINTKDLTLTDIYPNPSSGIYTLKSQSEILSYSIYNIQGQLIKQEINLKATKIDLNLTKNSKGIYYIIIKDSLGNKSSRKLILR